MGFLADFGGVVAGIGGIASVVLTVKSIRLTTDAQKKLDEILGEDYRYKTWIDAKLAEWAAHDWILPEIRPATIEEKRYLGRALREGILEKAPGYKDGYRIR